jgi:hypothetical protein
VQALVQVGGSALISCTDSNRTTCLHTAASCGNAAVVKLLLDAGGDKLLHKQCVQGHTALHFACQEGHVEVVKLLVAAGGQRLLLTLTRDGATCLHAACSPGSGLKAGHVAVVRFVCSSLGMDPVSASEWEEQCKTRMAVPLQRRWGGWDVEKQQRHVCL